MPIVVTFVENSPNIGMWWPETPLIVVLVGANVVWLKPRAWNSEKGKKVTELPVSTMKSLVCPFRNVTFSRCWEWDTENTRTSSLESGGFIVLSFEDWLSVDDRQTLRIWPTRLYPWQVALRKRQFSLNDDHHRNRRRNFDFKFNRKTRSCELKFS